MLLFLLPGAAGGTPLPTEYSVREGKGKKRGGPHYCWTHNKEVNIVVRHIYEAHIVLLSTVDMMAKSGLIHHISLYS